MTLPGDHLELCTIDQPGEPVALELPQDSRIGPCSLDGVRLEAVIERSASAQAACRSDDFDRDRAGRRWAGQARRLRRS